MTEGNNPEEKPSFFDFSEEEARSWPPASSYETEDETDVPETAAEKPAVEELDIENLFEAEAAAPAQEPKPETDTASDEEDSEIPEGGSKYVDMLFTDFGSFDGELSSEEEEPSDLLVPIEKRKEPEAAKPEPVESKPIIETPAPRPKEKKSTQREKEEREALDAILGARIEKPVVDQDQTPSPTKKSDDFDVDSMLDSTSSDEDESSTERDSNIREAIEDYDIGNVIDEDDSGSLPFRTYSAYDYNQETLTEASLDEAEEKQGLKLNRNILIVLSVLLLVGGWYGFSSLFNRKVPGVTNARKRKPPKKEQKSLLAISRELIPVWEITSQKSISDNEERKLVNDIYSESGRDNPFMMPDSVLADLKRAADAEIVKTAAPKSYRRKAYRATLVGVLTSKDSTIALINYQEAVFDVLEGTTRPKILKLATKAMDKAKANTQEMVIGSYIGPWQITRMDSPKDAFTEAKVHLQNQGQIKTLSMGRAEELGIFDDVGDIDNLDRSSDEEDEFNVDDAAAADDFEF